MSTIIKKIVLSFCYFIGKKIDESNNEKEKDILAIFFFTHESLLYLPITHDILIEGR